MGTSPPSHPPLPDTSAAPVVVSTPSTPSRYAVDARGRRGEGRGTTAPGAGPVRISSVLDVAALLGLAVHLAMVVDDMPGPLVLVMFSLPVIPLVVLFVACAAGMEDMTLRVRRIVGVVLPAMALAGAAARGRMDDLLAAALVVKLPLLTMPFGAFAAHRALRLDARAREHASAVRRAARESRGTRELVSDGRRAGSTSSETQGAAPLPAPARRRTALGAIVLLSGFVLLAAGGIETMRRVWWFGLVGMAMGVLCIARFREIGTPSSDRRLRRTDRGNPVVWLLAPVGALVAAARAVWILTVGS